MSQYAVRKNAAAPPRLLLEVQLDLTYRCSNHCRHCWLWEPSSPEVRDRELSTDEIRRIADEARQLGCQRWSISGGEPMLRDDFVEVFDYLTTVTRGYSLNTNGTLITPQIAQLMRRKGMKMVALYGATAQTYDAVTRHPGGFEQAMRGMALLREAGASFVVQLIPMRSNWHEWEQMLALADSLSPHKRVGAPWLYLSACADPKVNAEIIRQRLDPADVITLDEPRPACGDDKDAPHGPPSDFLFAKCIASRRNIHIDPYGLVSWCSFIKDPELRVDLRQVSLRDAWERAIPSMATKVRGGEEFREHCGSCEQFYTCRWCGVYAKLETGRYSAPVPYLCEVAREAERFQRNWLAHHRRSFQIGGFRVDVDTEIPFTSFEMKPELLRFQTSADTTPPHVTLQHFEGLPDIKREELGRQVYRKPPWAIYRKSGSWIYLGISPREDDESLHRVAVFSEDHRRGRIYSPPDLVRRNRGQWSSLSLFPTDQIWLAPVLADLDAVLLHAAGALIHGQGVLFVGHSSAGKSTTMELLKAAVASQQPVGFQAEVLCDDRNIVRLQPDGWRLYGTWSHGTTEDVSPSDGPLRAICFLRQAPQNALLPLTDRPTIRKLLLATLIRGVVSPDWWNKALDVVIRLAEEAPCYYMDFDRTGGIVPLLDRLARETAQPGV